MQINNINLKNKISQYARSTAFQRKITRSGVSIGAPGARNYSAENLGWDIYEVWSWANAFVKFVGTRISQVDRLDRNSDSYFSQRFKGVDPFQLLSYEVTNEKNNACGRMESCVVKFKFNPELVRRPSLYPRKYPKGVDNIIRLLSNGWDGRKKPYVTHFNVRGMWHGRMTRALAYREGDNFLRDIITAWNNGGTYDGVSVPNHTKSGILAVLDNSYVRVGTNSLGTSITNIRFGYKYNKRP